MKWTVFWSGLWDAIRSTVSAIWKLALDIWEFAKWVIMRLVEFVLWAARLILKWIADNLKVFTALGAGAAAGAAGGYTVASVRQPTSPAQIEIRAPVAGLLKSIEEHGSIDAGQALATIEMAPAMVSQQRAVESSLQRLLSECVIDEPVKADIQKEVSRLVNSIDTLLSDKTNFKQSYHPFHKGVPDDVELVDGLKAFGEAYEGDFENVRDARDSISQYSDFSTDCVKTAALYGDWQKYSTQVVQLYPVNVTVEVAGKIDHAGTKGDEMARGTLIAILTPSVAANPASPSEANGARSNAVSDAAVKK